MRAPLLIRLILLICAIGIGAVIVRHVTDALEGVPVTREASRD